MTSEEKLKEHNEDFINCNTQNQPAKLILPDNENAFVEFKNHKNNFNCPFVIYADFESLLQENLKDYDTEIRPLHNACSFICSMLFQYLMSINLNKNI